MRAIYFAKFACEQRPPGSGHCARLAWRLRLQKHARLSEIWYEYACQIDIANHWHRELRKRAGPKRRILALCRARRVDTLAAVL